MAPLGRVPPPPACTREQQRYAAEMGRGGNRERREGYFEKNRQTPARSPAAEEPSPIAAVAAGDLVPTTRSARNDIEQVRAERTTRSRPAQSSGEIGL